MSLSSSKQDGADRVKGPWSLDEDTLLEIAVKKTHQMNWSLVSKSVPGRSAKSCRERWFNHLSPDVNHDGFTKEEDEKIIELQAKNPGKWSAMARVLPGRTDNAIKNRWHSTLKRKGLSCDKNNFGDVGDSESPSNGQFNAGSGALILPHAYYNPGSPSGSNSNGRFLGARDVRPVEMVGGMHDPLTNLSLSLPGIDFTESDSQFPTPRINSPPPPAVGAHDVRPVEMVGGIHGQLTNLGLSLPGMDFTESHSQFPTPRINSPPPPARGNSPPPIFNQGGFGSPFMMAPVEEPVHVVAEDLDEQATINANFSGELLAVMQGMIRVEVEKYMEEFKQREEQRRFNHMVQRQRFMEHQHQRYEQHYRMYMQDSNEHSEVLENEAMGERTRVRRSE